MLTSEVREEVEEEETGLSLATSAMKRVTTPETAITKETMEVKAMPTRGREEMTEGPTEGKMRVATTMLGVLLMTIMKDGVIIMVEIMIINGGIITKEMINGVKVVITNGVNRSKMCKVMKDGEEVGINGISQLPMIMMEGGNEEICIIIKL
jgi:hypothetical protein